MPADDAVPSGALSLDERRTISLRLTAGLCGLGLLVLGSALIRLQPAQWQIGELCRAAAAGLVAVPTLSSGIRGITTGDTRSATDQLVSIAVLAAAASGDFVTATLIPLFLEIGRLFEERSSLGARAAIEGIRALGARHAVRWRDGREERVAPDALVPGELILVRAGERIPVDGTVVEGRAAVDQAAITGESLHHEVGPGSAVFAGTVSMDGLLTIQVKGIGADTVLGKVVQLLAEVERASVPLLRLFEKRAGAWLPLVLTIAATTLFFSEDLSRAIAVLVVATPTALVVAGPATVVAAMTVATRLRILIKSVDFLEHASDVDTLILDKTGTVTLGTPSVVDIRAAAGESADTVLSLAASCGFGSRHPVSRAVVAEAQRRGIPIAAPTSLQEHPGRGVVAMVGGERLILGRRGLLADYGLDVSAEPADDASRTWVARGDVCAGHIALFDSPKAEAREALAAIRALGIDRLILLTGDRAAVARSVGEWLGVDEVIADVLPDQKLEVVRAEQRRGRTVMMVGDGVNDAPALAGADVGVAIGAELNEVALGGADVALLGTDLARLPQLLELADSTRAIIGQNVWLAFGLSIVLIGLAAFGVLSPLSGALAQSAAVLAVVANSARLLQYGRRGDPAPASPQGALDVDVITSAPRALVHD